MKSEGGEMIHHMWRLSEGSDDNLGVAITADGLVLGRTRLIERRDDHFAVRDRTLNLVVPKGSMTEMQQNIINAARTRAESLNSPRVKLVITEL